MRKSSLVGLDIGSHTIKATQLNLKKTPPTIEIMGYIGLPHGTIENGEILDAQALEKALRELFSKEKITSNTVAFAVSGQSVIAKKISLPSLSEVEIQDQLSVIASQYIPFPKDEINVDFQILDEDPLNILLIAVKKKLLNSYCSVLEAADLNPVVVDTPATTLAHLVSETYGIQDPIALLHTGAYLSNFSVLHHGQPIFIQDFPFGGNHLSQDISDHLKLSFQEAEALKVTSLKEKHLPQGTLEIVQKSCEQLLQYIQEALNSYTDQFPNMPIKKMVLSGGTAKITELPDWIFKKTTLPTERLKPFGQIFPPEKEDLALLFSVSIGLALRGKTL